jgi:predicted nucleotidyltransferase
MPAWGARGQRLEDSGGTVMRKLRIDLPRERIAEFCKKWNIREFALFGSVLRDDFNSDSDIDVLVTLGEDAKHTLYES